MTASNTCPAWKPYRAIVGDLTPNRATVVRVLPVGAKDAAHRSDQRMVAADDPMDVGDRVWITGPQAVVIVG